MASSYPYLYRARVEQSIDPQKTGKIAARFLHGQDVPIEGILWVRYSSPLGGGDSLNGAGFFMPPEPGDIIYIMFEMGDPSSPVMIGCAFSENDSGNNNIPREGQSTLQYPINRIIKTKQGHKLELDDRQTTDTGSPTFGIRLETASGRGLFLNDSQNSTILSDGTSGHAIEIMPEGIRISTGSGSGLFISENPTQPGILFTGKESDDIGFQMTPGMLQMGAKQIVELTTQDLKLSGTSNAILSSQGGLTLSSGASITMGSSDAIAIDTYAMSMVIGENLNIEFTASGNFIVDIPVPGIPLESGNILMSSALGSITLRVGPTVPGAAPLGFTPSTPDFGDPSPLMLSRLTLGGTTGSLIALESILGGIFISGIPVVIPGLNQMTPPIPIYPAPFSPPIPTQPMVLGTNLNIYLMTLLTGFSVYFKALTASAPAWGSNGGGILSLSPPVIAAIAAVQVIIDKALAELAIPSPAGFLSSVAFTN